MIGIDRIIMMPVTSRPFVSADGSAPDTPLYVQIKGTFSGNRQHKVKLSNLWMHAGMHVVPVFYVLVCMDGPNSEQVLDVYVRHVDEEWTNQILKTVRKSQRPHGRLHEVELEVRFRDRDRAMVAADGDGFLRTLQTLVGASDYPLRKRAWWEKAGYDARPFTYSIRADAHELLSHSLGLTPEAEVNVTAIEERRFDIPMAVSAPPGRVRMRITGGPDVVLHADVGDAHYEASFQFRSQRMFLVESEERPHDAQLPMVRIFDDLMSLDLFADEVRSPTLKLSFAASLPQTLSRWAARLRFLAAMLDPKASVSVWRDGKRINKLVFPFQDAISVRSLVCEYLDRCLRLQELAQIADVHVGDVTSNDIFQWNSSRCVCLSVAGASGFDPLSFTPTSAPPEGVVTLAYPVAATLSAGRILCAVPLLRRVSPTIFVADPPATWKVVNDYDQATAAIGSLIDELGANVEVCEGWQRFLSPEWDVDDDVP